MTQAQMALFDALKRAPTLRRDPLRSWFFLPSPMRGKRPVFSAGMVRRMVNEGSLEWVNECRSAVRMRKAAE